MPPVEAMDPALILDEWINRTQNLPEEIRHLQDEVAEKDKQYDRCIRDIDELDGRMQKFIKANGSHAENPKEAEYRALILKCFEEAERLSDEKIALSQKMQLMMDKHVRFLDMQIKLLYDRNEPGFQDPDEVPSLIRPSAANLAVTVPALQPLPTTTATLAPVAATGDQVPVPSGHLQLKTNMQTPQHASSAPATPAANMIMNRQARESSAGPGSGAPKRGPRSNAVLSNVPTTSSGLARHSSLGPGNTTKSQQVAEGTQRAGSAGPRKTGAPGAGRKKSMPGGVAGGPKSGLSRVKRVAKNSPPSAADSEVSEAETGTGDDSDAHTHTGGQHTPAAGASSSSHLHVTQEGSYEPDSRGASQGHKEGEPGGSGVGGGGRNGKPRAHNLEDAMDVEDDETVDNRKYCICQKVSYGDMVACDNDDCPLEWFHWTCVGLKSGPTGKWYCPMCIEDRKKKGLK